MSLLERYLKLLQSVLPPISTAVATRLEQTTAHVEPWMQLFLTALHTELLDTQTRVEEVEYQLGKIVSKRGTLKDLCEVALKQLLLFLERSTAVKGQQEAQRKPSQTFPHLERIKQGQEIPDRLTNPSTIYESTTLLGELQNAIRPLQMFLEPLSLSERRQPLNNDAFSPNMVTSIRSMLAELKQSMDSEEMWGCECPDPHPYFLFLSTLRHNNMEDLQFEVDMLLELRKQHDQEWKETKVYAQASHENDVSSFSSQSHKDVTRENSTPMARLCEKTKRDNPLACLGLRLKDARLFQDKRTPSTLTWTRASPQETLGSLLESGQIIEPADTILLALLLSYSVLYLANGQWLPSGWDSASFRFLKSETGLPYILRPLLVSSTKKASKFAQHSETEIHRKPEILRLGITIFEILFMRPIDCYSLEDALEDSSNPSTNSRFFAACEAQYDLDLDWNMYETAKSAFDACLDLDSMLDLQENDDDQHAYYEYIIQRIIHPLENALSVISGVSPADIDALIIKSTRQASQSSRHAASKDKPSQNPRANTLPGEPMKEKVNRENSKKHKAKQEFAPKRTDPSTRGNISNIQDCRDEPQIDPSSSQVKDSNLLASDGPSIRNRVDSGQSSGGITATPEHALSTEVPSYASISENISPVEAPYSGWGQMPPTRHPREATQEIISINHATQELDLPLENETPFLGSDTTSGTARKKKFRLPAKFSKADKS